MDGRLSGSDFSETATELATTAYSRKALQLLTVLFTIRRPIRPAELASRCAVFRASPDLVEFLCSIPNSPIVLNSDLCVTMSPVGFETFREFLLNSNSINVTGPRLRIGASRPKRLWDDVVKVYFRKRKRNVFDDESSPAVKRRAGLDYGDEDEGDNVTSPFPGKIQNICTKVHFNIADDVLKSITTHPSDMSVYEFENTIINKAMVMTPFLIRSSSEQLHCKLENIKDAEDEKSTNTFFHGEVYQHIHTPERQHNCCNMETSEVSNPITVESTIDFEPHLVPILPTRILGNLDLPKDAAPETNFSSRTNLNDTYHAEVQSSNVSPVWDGNATHACRPTSSIILENERTMDGKREVLLIKPVNPAGEIENLILSRNTAVLDMPPETDSEKTNKVNCSNMMPSLDQDKMAKHLECQPTIPVTKLTVPRKQQAKPYAKVKTSEVTVAPKMQTLGKALKHTMVVSTSKEQKHCKRLETSLSMRQKLKQNHSDMHIKETKEVSSSILQKNRKKPKALPIFESFIVEEEEGSGGYGTVYRARRKKDGITVAIKCPHVNANSHHINNELKMLERFGGQNFIIKYEGCFKNGNSDCFVLEHVEHDRSEVLKKEIDVFQLQWYGYCMFRALSSLHKQGIVHRDVKPGNFLFSRKANRGCLIDFNLAKDLYQKSGTTNKSKARQNAIFDHVTLPNSKFVSPTKMRRFLSAKSTAAIHQERTKGSKSTLEKSLNQKAAGQSKVDNMTVTKSQGGDCSGITSAKDATSTRTPAERLREPMPCQGRKELINMLQEAMQSPNHEASLVTAPLRKRIAAPLGHVDRNVVYPSPMPLHSKGLGVAGAGLTKHKGYRKQKTEGPCVGTKGFRAPEVLFRSLHQGPKVDIWSAGVTLLYLMIGRAPFVGDPELNIKEIAKLKGSEELWEVAKLHNCESSFPVELYDMQSLPSMKLRDWCEANTKRPDFFKTIPRSLFDLVDSCLAVNPRVRISSEDALRHEFFAPCHERWRKKRCSDTHLDCGTASSKLNLIH